MHTVTIDGTTVATFANAQDALRFAFGNRSEDAAKGLNADCYSTNLERLGRGLSVCVAGCVVASVNERNLIAA